MRKLTISLLSLISLIVFGQEKEIKEAFKFFENGNKAQAYSILQANQPLIEAKSLEIDPSLYSKYLYIKESSFLDKNQIEEAAKFLPILYKYEKGPIYALKNKATKEKIFLLNKEDVNLWTTKGFSGLKEINSGTEYLQSFLPEINKTREALNLKATQEYNDKKYETAAQDFLQLYSLSKISDSPDDIFKYYAALSFHAAKNNSQAIELYKELIASGYTGKKTLYTAVQAGKKVGLSEEQYNLFKKTPNSGFSDFSIEKTPSVEDAIYNNLISLLYENKEYKEALAFTENGLSKLGGDKNLTNWASNLYYETGQIEKYTEQLKEAINKNPNDYTSYYNLGILYSRDSKTKDLAESYYKKAIEINPAYSAAYLNLAALYLQPDEQIVAKMQKAAKNADQKKYDAGLNERKTMFKAALPYLEQAYIYNPKEKSLVKSLLEAYKALGNQTEYEKMLKVEKTL